MPETAIGEIKTSWMMQPSISRTCS